VNIDHIPVLIGIGIGSSVFLFMFTQVLVLREFSLKSMCYWLVLLRKTCFACLMFSGYYKLLECWNCVDLIRQHKLHVNSPEGFTVVPKILCWSEVVA